MNKSVRYAAPAVALALAACVSVPTGPTVMVLPGSGKNFEQFQADNAACRQFAMAQIGGTAGQAAQQSQVNTAVVGTAVGAVAGAAIGGQRGAAVGAGTGLVAGTAAGAGTAEASAYGSQRQYDHAYVQCMYAKGHKVPVTSRGMTEAPRGTGASRNSNIPPPPAGTPPAPPPDAR